MTDAYEVCFENEPYYKVDFTEFQSITVKVESVGTDTSDATASSADILTGKTAYVNGDKLVGAHVCESEQDEELLHSILNRTITSFSNDKLEEIGAHAFEGCTNLTSVSIPNITAISGEYAFSTCTNLTSVNLPKLKTIFGEYVFSECTSLTSISLPKLEALSDGSHLFYACTSLESVDLPSLETLKGHSSTFYECTSLKNVNLPLCKSLGTYTFSNCTSLESINLPSFDGNLDFHDFNNCESLKRADFGGNVTFPKSLAFQGCWVLETLILRGDTVAQISNINNFSGTPIIDGDGYIYVPSALVSAYKKAKVWSNFSGQFRAIEDYPSVCG